MKYTTKQRNEIFDKIIDHIIDNKASLRDALKLKNVCDQNTFYNWIKKYKTLKERYARATSLRHDGLFEDILKIANENNADVEVVKGKNGKDIIVIKGEVVQRSRLKIDAIKWMLGKMNPTKYGDKVEVEHTGKIDLKQITGMEVT